MNTTLRMKIVVPVSGGTMSTETTQEARTGGSTAPREFLAMRARQKKAKQRARRWKLGFLAVGCAGMVALALAMPRWRQHNLALVQKQLSPVATAVAAPAPVAAMTPAPVDPPAQVPAVLPAIEAAQSTEAKAATGCEDDFSRRQWRAAIESCGKAFETTPDAEVALKLGHAHWSRGEVARAGVWANRAVAMGTDNADAYVLIGHAEREAGNPANAISAYRRYLRLAPYGWHASRVRAAIRELKTELPEASN
jgi:tetratricopeptide (TPR) repeat protein